MPLTKLSRAVKMSPREPKERGDGVRQCLSQGRAALPVVAKVLLAVAAIAVLLLSVVLSLIVALVASWPRSNPPCW